MLNDYNGGNSLITDGHGFRSLFTESMNLWQSFLDVEITGMLFSEKKRMSLNMACYLAACLLSPR